MHGTTSGKTRAACGLLTGVLAAGLAVTPVTAHASAAPWTTVSAAVGAGAVPAAFFKKKKKKRKKSTGLSPESAEAKRQAIRDAAQEDLDTGDLDAAAQTLEDNAALLGDPVTMNEAGAVRLEVARRDRSIEAAEASIVTTTVALDILHFYDAVAAGEATSQWLVIEPGTAAGLIREAEAQVEEAEALIEEIEAEQAAAAAPVASNDSKDKRRRNAKPGTGFLIGGGVATAVGVTGIGLAMTGLFRSRSAQDEVEGLGGDPQNQERIDELDEEGARANRLAYAGVGVAVAGLAIGIPLLVIGAKKRKDAGPGANASVRVAPVLAGRLQGVAVTGRF